jgi:hypothetical protein
MRVYVSHGWLRVLSTIFPSILQFEGLGDPFQDRQFSEDSSDEEMDTVESF